MKKIKSILLAGFVGLSLIGCASSVDKQVIETELASANLMTDKEILDLVSGATISGISATDGKTKWVQTYSTVVSGENTGIISGDFGGSAYDSTWEVKDSQLCEDWGSGNGCWYLESVEDSQGQPAIQRYSKKGKMKYLIYIE